MQKQSAGCCHPVLQAFTLPQVIAQLRLLQYSPRIGSAVSCPGIEAHACTLHAATNVGVLAQNAIVTSAENADASLVELCRVASSRETGVLNDTGNRVRWLCVIGSSFKHVSTLGGVHSAAQVRVEQASAGRRGRASRRAGQ